MSFQVDLDLVAGGQVTLSLPAPGAGPGCCLVGMPGSGADRVWPIAKALLGAAGRPICDLFEDLRALGVSSRELSPASLNRLLKREGYAFGVVWGVGSLGDEVDSPGRATILLARDPRERVGQSYLENEGVAVSDFLRSASVEAIAKQYARVVDFCRRHPSVRVVRAEEAGLGWRRFVLDLVRSFNLEIAPEMASEIVDRIESTDEMEQESFFWDRCDAAASAELDARFAEALSCLGYADTTDSPAAGRLKRAFNRQGFRDLAGSRIRRPFGSTSPALEAVGASPDAASEPPRPDLYERDPELFSRLRPHGSKEITVLGRRIVMEADASGSRPVLGQPPTGKKTVAIYGCSFAFGVGVNFDETFCSHLQAWLPAWRIENHGVPAYSGHRNLIQLERDARWGVADYVTFCWIPDHFRRNVAAASTIQRFSELQGARIGAAQGWFPRAAIGPDGNLTFRKVKFPRPDLIGIDLAEFLPDACHLDLVGAKIFQRAHRVVTQAGGVFFVTTLQGELSPMVVGALEKDGIPILDASLDADKYLLLPDDRHPNAAAHKLYAERIRDYLRARESVASARSDGDAPAARTAGDQAGIG